MVLDDVDSIFSSMAHLGLLRSALWGIPDRHIRNQPIDDLPGSFVFESDRILCERHPETNDAFKAVLSRCDIFELSASQEEVIELMRRVASAGYESLTPTTASRSWISSSSTATTELSRCGCWNQASARSSMPALRGSIGDHSS